MLSFDSFNLEVRTMCCVKKLLSRFVPLAAMVAAIALAANAVLADIAFNGDVSPANTASWTASTNGYIGSTGSTTYTAGTGTVRVTSGTLSSKNGYLGYLNHTSGTATVDGSISMSNVSTWNAGTNGLYVGYGGTGTLYITNGGLVKNGSGYLGYTASTGLGAVTVDNSTWTNTSSLYVGYAGTGTLAIQNGPSSPALPPTSPTCQFVGRGNRG